MKKNLNVLFTLLVLFALVGCGRSVESEYDGAIESGKDYIAAEDYRNAEKQFKTALEYMPEDEYAATIIEQLQLYQMTLNEIENNDQDNALVLAQNVMNVTEGSEELYEKAVKVIEHLQEDIDKEQTEDNSNHSLYTYSDFKGIYALYEGEPFNSNIVAISILSDNHYTDIVVDWMEYTAADLSSVTVEGDILTLSYEDSVNYPAETLTAQLQVNEKGEKSLIINEHTLYQLTRDQFNALGYDIEEDLFIGI